MTLEVGQMYNNRTEKMSGEAGEGRLSIRGCFLRQMNETARGAVCVARRVRADLRRVSCCVACSVNPSMTCQ